MTSNNLILANIDDHLEAARSGNQDSLNWIIEHYEPEIRKIAYKFFFIELNTRTYFKKDELLSIKRLILMIQIAIYLFFILCAWLLRGSSSTAYEPIIGKNT